LEFDVFCELDEARDLQYFAVRRHGVNKILPIRIDCDPSPITNFLTMDTHEQFNCLLFF